MTQCEEAAKRQRDIQRLLQAIARASGVKIDNLGLEMKL